MSVDIRSEICKAVDVILKERLKSQETDYTVTAEIVECLDESTGLYRVKYQDSYFTAYAVSDIIYSAGQTVDVIVPNGDFSKTKKITNGTSVDPTAFLPILNTYDTLHQESENALAGTASVTLGKTSGIYNQVVYENTLGKGNWSNINKPINFSLKDEDYFVLESDILPSNMDNLEGKLNFGIKVTLDIFKNLKTDDIPNENYSYEIYDSLNPPSAIAENTYYYEKQYYYFNVEDMSGNPFLYSTTQSVNKIFDISNDLVFNLEKVELFINNYSTTENYDVTFSNLKLYAAKRYDLEALNTYILRIKSNKYKYYAGSRTGNLDLEAELLIRGRRTDLSKASTIYWFREDASVSLDSEYYSVYGGEGWKCLNEKNYYSSTDFEWSNGDATLSIPLESVGIKDRFKVVVHYGSDRQIVDTAYFKIENVDYRNDKGYNEYSLKAFRGRKIGDTTTTDSSIVKDELNRVSSFYSIDYNYIILKANFRSVITSDFNYYWSKSDATGMTATFPQVKSDTMVIYAKEVNNYSYFSCTMKDNAGNVIFNDNIRIDNLLSSNILASIYQNIKDDNAETKTYIDEVKADVEKNNNETKTYVDGQIDNVSKNAMIVGNTYGTQYNFQVATDGTVTAHYLIANGGKIGASADDSTKGWYIVDRGIASAEGGTTPSAFLYVPENNDQSADTLCFKCGNGFSVSPGGTVRATDGYFGQLFFLNTGIFSNELVDSEATAENGITTLIKQNGDVKTTLGIIPSGVWTYYEVKDDGVTLKDPNNPISQPDSFFWIGDPVEKTTVTTKSEQVSISGINNPGDIDVGTTIDTSGIYASFPKPYYETITTVTIKDSDFTSSGGDIIENDDGSITVPSIGSVVWTGTRTTTTTTTTKKSPFIVGLLGTRTNNGVTETYQTYGTYIYNITTDSAPTVTSDRSIKNNIQDLDKAQSADFIYNLKPKSYNVSFDNDTTLIHHGLIAQDVKALIGDENLAVHDGTKDLQGIRYEELIADLIATVQKQHEEIEALQVEVNNLKGGN